MISNLKIMKLNEFGEMKWLAVEDVEEEILSASKSTSWNDHLNSDTVQFKPQLKNFAEWDENERGERWYGDEMIPLAESGDQ